MKKNKLHLAGLYVVKYKGQWVIAEYVGNFNTTDYGNHEWRLPNGKIIFGDDSFDKIIYKLIK